MHDPRKIGEIVVFTNKIIWIESIEVRAKKKSVCLLMPKFWPYIWLTSGPIASIHKEVIVMMVD